MRNQNGFTLIELVVVIVILGLLAAVAVPKFIDITTQARVSSVNGAAGSIRSAVALARAQYMVNGNTAATTVTMSGEAVTVIAGVGNGQPAGTAAGIGTAIPLDGFTVDYGDNTAVTIQPTNGGSATCGATYNDTNGTVAVDITGC